MTDNEQYILQQMSTLEQETLDKVCELLKGYETRMQDYLAHFVASLCDVKLEDMLTDCNVLHAAQARWLYWYSYRYMTSETYDKIAERTARYFGKRFTMQGVAAGVNKMAQMIEQEPIWKKRWTIIKRLLKSRDDNVNETPSTIRIVAYAPKGTQVKFITEQQI